MITPTIVERWRNATLRIAAYACVALVLATSLARAAAPIAGATTTGFTTAPSGGLVVLAQQASDGPPASQAPTAEQSAQPDMPGASMPNVEEGPRIAACAWLGQRIVSLLIRNDAMTAKDFTPFYERFNCPEDHLLSVFACVIRNEDTIEETALAELVASCWHEPRYVNGGAAPSEQTGDTQSSYRGNPPKSP